MSRSRRLRPSHVASLLLLAVFTAAAGAQSNGPVSFDVVLRHGTIIDGTGLRPYRADLAITGGSIAAIGNLSRQRATLEIDATGLYVAPGFINIHSHASADALPRAENMLTQGVTTEILNADGGGAVDIAEQMSRLAGPGLAVNVGANIGFNAVWSNVVGPSDRRATAEEIDRMRALVVSGLTAGAWGVSAGLDYKPAYFAQTAEVIKVVEAASKWRTNFTNHDRITPESNFSSRTGIAETIDIGTATGLVPVITHMKVQGHEQGTAAGVLGLLSRATAGGHFTAADAYPYLAGQTGLGALIVPAWAQDGGRPEMLKRFADPEQRARIVKEAEEVLKARFGGAEGVYLPATRQRLITIMTELNVSAGEAIVRLLEQGSPSAILRFGAEGDVRQILRYPDTSIACDCGATTSTATHPRAYGTYPRVLGHYVRDERVLTWQDAVRKMTGLPAATIGMVDRGFLVPGMAADVTVFDPKTVIDRATYEQPALPSEGIRHVFVNGRHALRDGQITGAQGGRVVARTTHMPSRPMSADVARRVAAKDTVVKAGGSQDGSGGEIRIAFDVTQKPGSRSAAGFFRLTDGASGTRIEMNSLGLLQTTMKWASFTGRSALRPGEPPQAITVTVEQADPFDYGHATVTVDGESGYRLSGAIAAESLVLSAAGRARRR